MNAPQDKKTVVKELLELGKQKGQLSNQDILDAIGEMDFDQLWETTLNPETRMMRRVEIEDGRMASEITELLMGSDVPPRKAFIYEHANDANLDI